MERIKQILIPDIGTGVWQSLFVIFNLFGVIFSILLLAWLLWYSVQGRKKSTGQSTFLQSSVKEFLLASIPAIVIICLFMWLPIALENTGTVTVATGKITNAQILQSLVDILDPPLMVSSLADYPFPLSGWNLAIRIGLLYGFFFAIVVSFWLVKVLTLAFRNFLEGEIFLPNMSKKVEKKHPTENPPVGRATEEEESKDAHFSRKGWDKIFTKVILAILSGTSGIGILTYILGGDSAKEAVTDVLEALIKLLNMATLLYKVEPGVAGASGIGTFLLNFLFIALSVLILAVYAAIGTILLTFVHIVWDKRAEIIGWAYDNRKPISICVGIVLLIIVSCVVIYALGSGFNGISSFLTSIMRNSPIGLFTVVADFALILLAICAVLLILAVLVSFICFVANFAIKVTSVLMKKLQNKHEQDNAWIVKNAKIVALIIIGGMLFLGILFSYHTIRQLLNEVFFINGTFTWEPLWMVARLTLLCAVAEGILLAIVVALQLGIFLVLGAVRLIVGNREKPQTGRDAETFVDNTLQQLFLLFSLIPYLIQHIYQAAKSFFGTILQIFVGYSTESDKNRALFVAACFASLASLINTFFGLKGFYNSSQTMIPAICSFAIACAVQLAMLIFGMKAGERITETKMSNSFEKAEKPIANKLPTEHDSLTPIGHSQKHVPSGWYLVAYVLLMLISTGFAYNNLFSYYADSAELHERVYDQVRSKTFDTLKLNETATSMSRDYNDNTNQILALLQQAASDASTEKQRATDDYHREIANETGEFKDRAENALGRYTARTSDFNTVLSAIKDFLQMDYDSIGEAGVITAEEYIHYWRENAQESYRTYCFIITINGHDFVVGRQVTGGPVRKITVDSKDIHFPSARYLDPDKRDQTIIRSARSIPNVNKYSILRLLLEQYEILENEIYSASTTKEASTDMDKIYDLLSKNENIDEVRKSLATLYKSSVSDEEELVTVGDLPRIIASYLTPGESNQVGIILQNSEKSDNGSSVMPQSNSTLSGGSQALNDKKSSENTLSKYENYTNLSVYIDRALIVNDLLNAYRPAKEQSSPGEESLQKNGSGEDTTSYAVRKYRNYAQGITYSDFQISYDTLLRGFLGINPVKKEGVVALYSAWPIAVFLLVICALIDFMAFFAGLLLFKDIYLFAKNHRIIEIGYLDYEAELTNFFTPPEGRAERMLHLAFMYRILHGDPSGFNKEEERYDLHNSEAENDEHGAETTQDTASPGSLEAAESPSEEPIPATTGTASSDSDAENGTMQSSIRDGESVMQSSVGVSLSQEYDDQQKTEHNIEAINTGILHAIMRTEDFQKYYRNGKRTLAALGVTLEEDDSPSEETKRGSSSAHLRLWLANFLRKNGITFDDLFGTNIDASNSEH